MVVDKVDIDIGIGIPTIEPNSWIVTGPKDPEIPRIRFVARGFKSCCVKARVLEVALG